MAIDERCVKFCVDFLDNHIDLLEKNDFITLDSFIQEEFPDEVGMIYSFLNEELRIKPLDYMSYVPKSYQFCSSSPNIEIPKCVTEIRTNAFYGCSQLKQITIPEGVTIIGDNVFANCTTLESIEIPKSVKSIGKYAFYGCSELRDVTILNNDVEIGKGAFWKCPNVDHKFRGF